MAKIESGVRAVIAYIDSFNAHDVDGLVGLFADPCLIEDSKHLPGQPGALGKDQIAAYFRNIFQTLKDSRIEAVELTGYGMRCILAWKLIWTDDGGAENVRHGLSLFRISGTKISEILEYVKDCRSDQDFRQ
jgi:hypothetical protein